MKRVRTWSISKLNTKLKSFFFFFLKYAMLCMHIKDQVWIKVLSRYACLCICMHAYIHDAWQQKYNYNSTWSACIHLDECSCGSSSKGQSNAFFFLVFFFAFRSCVVSCNAFWCIHTCKAAEIVNNHHHSQGYISCQSEIKIVPQSFLSWNCVLEFDQIKKCTWSIKLCEKKF